MKKLEYGCIYVLTCLVTLNEYVGQAKCWKTRWRGHCAAAHKGAENVIYRAMRKYGVENFAITIVRRCPIEELNDWEEFYIDKYETLVPDGYNMTAGGEGLKASDALRRRMSASKLKFYDEHPEVKLQISEVLKAVYASNPALLERVRTQNVGRPVSEEARRKIGKKSKGHIVTVEMRAAISRENTGKTRSPEQRANHGAFVSAWWKQPKNKRKMKKSLAIAGARRRGRKRDPDAIARGAESNRGKKRSEETRARCSASAKKRWKDATQRELTSAKLKAYFTDPANREKNRQGQLNGANCRPEHRIAAAEKTNAYFAKPANRKKHSLNQVESNKRRSSTL